MRAPKRSHRLLRRWLAPLLAASSLFTPSSGARADWELSGAVEPAPAPAGGPLVHARRTATDAVSGRQATVHLVMFDARRCAFRVLDQPEGGGRQRLGDLLRGPAGQGVLAAVNGGYFHPDYAPLGLLVADSRVVHPAQKAALLSGLLLVGADGALSLVRSAAYRPGPTPPRQALQAGPFLVDNGQPTSGLNAARSARRTAVLTDGRGRWALAAVTTPLTLADAGALLARPGLGPDGFTVRRALNLDGGSSTALWVRAEPEPFYEVKEWGTVRNFLAVVPK